MLYPAQLYKEELTQKLVQCWYTEKYSYYFGGEFREYIVPTNPEGKRDFVHLTVDGKVDGYFSYWHDRVAKSLNNFGLISFTNNGFPLIIDVEKHLKHLIKIGEIQRIEFWAFEDNPVNKLYKHFMNKYNGKEVGYLHNSAWFDGKYHNTIIYEILIKNNGHE